MINTKRTWGIKDLRKLGGEWKAIQEGFGRYRYEGNYCGDDWEIRSFAHMANLYEGDDENFVVKWHVLVNGQVVGYTKDLRSAIRFIDDDRADWMGVR